MRGLLLRTSIRDVGLGVASALFWFFVLGWVIAHVADSMRFIAEFLVRLVYEESREPESSRDESAD